MNDFVSDGGGEVCGYLYSVDVDVWMMYASNDQVKSGALVACEMRMDDTCAH